MIREEAIRILDNLKPTNTKSSFDAYVVGEAITIAIKALEQESILDKIRAEVPRLGLGIIGQNLVLELIDKYRKEN